jgi:signal transduction histidine kinase
MRISMPTVRAADKPGGDDFCTRGDGRPDNHFWRQGFRADAVRRGIAVSEQSREELARREAFIEQRLTELSGSVTSLRLQVQEAQRLATLGTLAGILAHEFRNALTPVLNYAQLALQDADPAFRDKALNKIMENAGRAASLAERVLDFSRGPDDDRGPVELIVLVREALACLGRDPAKDNVAVQLDVPDGLSVHGDRGQLLQVLVNILLNALQAMRGRRGELRIAATTQPGGRNAVLAISDTGMGIPPENIDRIFQPFFTTRTGGPEGTRGTGLGLSVCRDIVAEHGGQIRAESTPGEGSKFTLILPTRAMPQRRLRRTSPEL